MKAVVKAVVKATEKPVMNVLESPLEKALVSTVDQRRLSPLENDLATPAAEAIASRRIPREPVSRMKPATSPRARSLEERLLVVSPENSSLADTTIASLPSLLRPGDLLIVNDAATIPASLHGHVRSRSGHDRNHPDDTGDEIEIRLTSAAVHPGANALTDARNVAGENDDAEGWLVVVLGAGDWRQRTEDRPAPPRLSEGDRITFGVSLGATVIGLTDHPRLVRLRFDVEGDALWQALYRLGRPVQYSYVSAPLAPWSVNTVYATRPWAVEMPSAGRPLTWGLLLDLVARGVKLASLTHAAGLSSTGDPALDARLPLPERYEIPLSTVSVIQETRGSGGRVIAVGTSVVRALEGCVADRGALMPGPGKTSLRIGPGFTTRVVDGLLTGVHEPTESHFDLLEAFASHEVLEAAYHHAVEAGYLGHELGDSALFLRGVAA